MPILTPKQLEVEAKRRGLNISQACRMADVPRSVFTRWKKGDTRPNVETYADLENVILSAPLLDSEAVHNCTSSTCQH